MPTTTSERLIRYRMTQLIDEGPVSPDDVEKALDIALYTERHIFCPVAGGILDSRTARGLYCPNDSGEGEYFQGAVSPAALDTVRERLEDAGLSDTVSIFDPADVWKAVRSR